MAPDAEQLRQRKAPQVVDPANTTEGRFSSLKALGGTEVVIDGVIYDISTFEHPGGESILVFGGNDVSVQYRMIHPYHTKKHLDKMKRVGVVPDYNSE